jgi:hypothetical protein
MPNAGIDSEAKGGGDERCPQVSWIRRKEKPGNRPRPAGVHRCLCGGDDRPLAVEHTGIHYEISQGPAVISNNVVQNNNLANEAGHGGIGIIDSKNANVLGNTLGGNKGTGIRASKDKRGFALTNISIHTNKLSGDELAGCGAGVTCYGNS